MNKKYKRYFAFGCSFVSHNTITLADMIASNFDGADHYNFGRGGASNEYICNMLFRVHQLKKFNPDTDFVTIGVTGVNRMSIVTSGSSGNPELLTYGDHTPVNMGHHELVKMFSENFENSTYSLYRTVESLRKISLLLTSLNIDHVIYPSLHPNLFVDLTPDINQQLFNQLMSYMHINQSLEAFCDEIDYVSGIYYDSGEIDGHLHPAVHYQYLKKYFPLFDTQITNEFFQHHQIDTASMAAQILRMKEFTSKFKQVGHNIYGIYMNESN